MSRKPANGPRRLILPAPVAAEIVASAHRATPREACGVLVGRAGAKGTEVTGHAAARNVHRRPADRYELAPEDFLAAERRARAEGLEVVGFWHSHPATGAAPSAADQAAAWDGYSYLIVSLAAGRDAELRSWRLRDGELAEEEVREPPPIAEGTRP